jgi:hypothetical protein
VGRDCVGGVRRRGIEMARLIQKLVSVYVRGCVCGACVNVCVCVCMCVRIREERYECGYDFDGVSE